MSALKQPNSPVEIWRPLEESSAKMNTNIPGHRYVVIGSGPVGMRFVQELLKRNPSAQLQLFGNEPFKPYNRVQLSALLAGEVKRDDIDIPIPNSDDFPNFSYTISSIKNVDTDLKTITDSHGQVHDYDSLILATGARAHVPHIPGVDQAGVYTFRNLKDTEALYARISRSRHVVVVGGGLLGLEAARALLKANTKVTLVQQGSRLMNRQLDDDAANLLQAKVEAMGINVIIDSGVRNIHGEGRVTGVTTRDGSTVACDTVLLCAGIQPNIEVARAAKIKVTRGILVDDRMNTSAQAVYAIGECCEHRGETYGLVNPGFEQASVLADVLSKGGSVYQGSLQVSRLKVVGESVCSMGEVADLPARPLQREIRYRNRRKGLYRKLVIYKGRLIGAVGYGEWEESRRVQEAHLSGRRIWVWQYLLFMLTGRLWALANNDDVRRWPRSTVVCQCNNISQGELTDAILAGFDDLQTLKQQTSAGTVCGSCKPLLSEMLGLNEPAEKEKAWAPTLVASIMAVAVVAVIALIPAMMVSETVQSGRSFEAIWNDKFWKQVTGFTVLGMSVVGLLVSIRKRITGVKLLEFAYWRVLHVVLGVLCAGTLILHTGLNLGVNLNRYLMIDFLLVLSLGAVAGVTIALSHKTKPTTSRKLRNVWTWAHILVVWPLPVLLAIHILSVYYF